MKMKATRICPECKSTITYKTLGHRNDAEKHNRCCRKCGYKSGQWKLKPNSKCQICHKPIYRIPSRLGTNHFCSYGCRNKYYSKENSFVWKGGEYLPYKKGREIDWTRRREKKAKALCLIGNKCSICGYDKCIASLDFHHKNPLEKNDTLKDLWSRRWEIIEIEIKKCIILCSNCHREHHFVEREKNVTVT